MERARVMKANIKKTIGNGAWKRSLLGLPSGLPAGMLAAFAAGLLGTSAPAAAHHSIAMYDTDNLIEIAGVVSRIEWTSPHVFVFFNEQKADGTTVEWSMELDPPVLLRRYGWLKSTVEQGDTIKCTGAPAKSGSPAMRGAIVELDDGTQLRVWSRV